MSSNRDVYRLAVDPGDVHVGWAAADDNGVDSEIETGEVDASNALEFIGKKLRWARSTGRRVELVIEAYVHYPHVTHNAWSPQETSEMIGALKYIAGQMAIPWIEQGADIKKPTRAQLPARGIRQVGSGTHARDAELHLWYRILKKKENA